MKGIVVGDKGKKDRGKREEQKKGMQSVKEKRRAKKDKTKAVEAGSTLTTHKR